jgi:hypothetical protein
MRTNRDWSWIVCLGLLFCIELPGLPAAPPNSKVKLLVPAYFYPGGKELDTWNHLIAAGAKTPIIAIANPASGPGTQIDPAYTSIIQKAQAGHIQIIAYVSTSYAKRTAAEIKHDIDLWVQFYPTIQGVFFDEQTSEAAKADFYLDIATYARTKIKNAFVVTNPGTICAEDYFSKKVADTICTVESAEGLEKYSPPAWAAKYPAAQFYGLAYKIEKAHGMQTSLKAVEKKHFGYVFITDDKLPNPWDTLPPYWEEEVRAVQGP